MKLKYKDIRKFEQVEIDIKDKRSEYQIAILVDSPLFLFDIQGIRDHFHIKKSFIYGDYQSWNNHLFELAGFDLNDIKKINSTDNEAKKQWVDSRIDEYERLNELRLRFSESLANIRQLFRYPAIFDDVIQQVVLFNRVSDFKTTYATLIREPSKLLHSDKKHPDVTLAIILTPNSTLEDVNKAYLEAMQLKPSFELYNPLYINLDNDPDTTKRDRLWFWQKYHDDRKTTVILNDWNDSCPKDKLHESQSEVKKCDYCKIDNESVVDTAIHNYKQKIQFLFPDSS